MSDPVIVMPPKLTVRQQRFAMEYCLDWNASAAARRAGYSEHTAGVQGYALLKKPEIQAVIRVRKAEIDAEWSLRIMQAQEVIARLTEIARSDMGDLIGEFDDVENVSLAKAKARGKSHLVKKVRTRTTYVTEGEKESQIVDTELEMYSAHDALRDLGKHYALFAEKLVVTLAPQDVAAMSDDDLRQALEASEK